MSEKEEDVSRSSETLSFNSNADRVEFVLQRELMGQIALLLFTDKCVGLQ